MTHFPVDAPKVKVIKTFELLGFSLVRERVDWHADDVTDSEDPDDLLLVLEADTICRNHRGL